MKKLGLDLGSKTVGVAISDSMNFLASVYDTIRFEEDNYRNAKNQVLEIVEKEKIDTIILGYPKHMNGDIGVRAKISEEFKELLLEANKDLKIILWDERLTSKEVNNIMLEGNLSRKKRKGKKDELAARVILQSYLDSI